ncbi:MAG: hypothetical protein ACYDDO_10430 [Acidiferrobacterales bacterium]
MHELSVRQALITRAEAVVEQHRAVEMCAIRVHREGCSKESEATTISLVCVHCDDWHTRLASGGEMPLASVEFTTNNELNAAESGK